MPTTFQAWPFIYGTLITSIAAIVLAIPISLGVAVFLAELCPAWLRLPLNWLVNNWATPSSISWSMPLEARPYRRLAARA